jgi:plasmid stabilization system protein ParE
LAKNRRSPKTDWRATGSPAPRVATSQPSGATSRKTADAVIKRIRDRCRLLEVAPAQGRVRDDGPPIAGEVRSVAVYPYVVFYRIAGNVVQVLRVVDGRRDLETAFLSK